MLLLKRDYFPFIGDFIIQLSVCTLLTVISRKRTLLPSKQFIVNFRLLWNKLNLLNLHFISSSLASNSMSSSYLASWRYFVEGETTVWNKLDLAISIFNWRVIKNKRDPVIFRYYIPRFFKQTFLVVKVLLSWMS